MKKRILAMLLCLALVGSMLPMGVIAEDGGDIVVQDETEAIDALAETEAPTEETEAPTEETTPEVVCSHLAEGWTQWDGTTPVPTSGNIVLTCDMELESEILLSSGTLSICLNGNDIIAASGNRIFQVTSGAVLNIHDCKGTGSLTGADYTNVGGAVYVKTGAAFNLHGGNITGNETTKDGGAVSVADGIFNMYGGSITNNHSDGGGGAVCAGTNSQVNIYGGSITGNSAKNGGAMVTQGTNPKVLLKNVSITGNSVTNLGGGIYVGKPDSVTLGGKLNITGNTKGTAASNLFVVSTASEERAVIQDNLDAGSTIGIGIYNTTKSNVLVKSGATEATTNCYIPDDGTKIVKYSDGKLLLTDKPADAAEHTDTEGYTSCGHGAVTWTGWYGTDTLPASDGYYYLSGDVYLTDTWKVENGQNITICLNGFDITQTAAKRVIHVTNGTVNICDCTAKTEEDVYTAGKITGANTSERGAGVGLETGGVFNLYDGCITGNTSSSYGGGVYAHTSTFNMYGGEISGNHADSQSGGGICINGNVTLNITGGSIINNTAKNAGAIVVQGAGNAALLKDCTITGNTATNLGGGVYVGKPDSVTISGKLNITGNTKGGAASNLFVVSTASEARPVIQKDLDEASTIGIGIYNTTKSNVLVKSGATKATLKCFTSDDSTKFIEYKDGQLLLVDEAPVVTTGHANTEGYEACGHGQVEWTEWTATNTLPTASGTYFLTGNVNLTNVCQIKDGQTVTICLNGYDIIQTTAGKRIVEVTNGTLNICDCTKNGKLTGADVTANGGAIIANGSSAKVNLYDITLTGNKANNGGALSAHGSSVVTMNGVTVTGNTVTGQGGGVYVVDKGTKLTLNNVTVTDNTTTSTSERAAGGVHVNAVDSTTLNGKVIIDGNFRGTGESKVRSNLEVDHNRLAIDNALTPDSRIGLSVFPLDYTQVISLISKAAVDCYFSDDPAKIPEVKGNVLHLVVKPVVIPVHANTVGYTACDHDKLTWTGWDKTDSLPTESGNYFLGADVELTKIWNAGEDKEITICLNGYSITQITDGLRVIRVGGSTLNICDCTAHVDENGEYISGKITGGSTDASDDKGNAGAMMLTNGGTFRLYDGNITDNHTEGNGVIVAQKGFNLEMHGGRIMNNTAGKQGGAVYMSKAVMTMTGGEITGNEAVGSGGAIYNYGGEFTMSGGVIGKNNTTTGGGGGIALKNASADAKAIVTISGGEVRENTAKLDGSGVRMDSGEFTLSGGKIIKNGTEEGSGGGLRVGDGKVTISGGQISENIGGNAAGILAVCDVTMTGGEISGNIGSGNGPGIYVSGANFYLSGGSIINNDATGNGGGVYLAQAKMEMTGGLISGNRGGMGGGIYSLGGTVTVKGGTIKNNDAYKLGGGGIYCVNRFADDKVTVTAEATLNVAGGEISGNKAKTDGAGLRVDSGKFQMSDGLISGNSAEGSCGGMSLKNVDDAVISGGTITKNKGQNAAGVYINQGNLTISGGEISHNAGTGSGAGVLASSANVKFSGGVIEENSAKGDGAGLYISNGKLTLCGGKVNKNRAEKVCGGVLATKNAKVYFTSGTISGNTAKASSGGMMIQNGSYLQMSGGTISNNITVNHGGGIYVNKNSSASFSGGSIVSNAARKSGGGIYVGKDAKLTMTGGNISSNDAKTQGGGVLVAGTTTISGGKISKNTSKREGAGVYITNVTMTFTGGSIEENVTEYNGGGICVRGETGVLEMSEDAKVLNNECKESGGGILVQGQGKLIMHGGEVIGNYAPNGGGGIRLHNCPAEIYGGKINENISNGAGAGIYSNLSLIIKDTEVCNNKIVANPDITVARSSAAIRTYNESTLVMENVKVIGNACDGRAGAIEIAYHVKADIKNCLFQENTATERGGTFSVYREGELYMNGCTISSGSTNGNGGAFSLDPYGEIFITDCTITNNAADMGGVAYVGTKGRAELVGCTVENNVADSHASVIWANGSVVLEDTVVSGNKDKKGGAAIYLDNAGQDTESYMPGVHEIRGNTTVYGNDGGDLVLVNDAFINIHGDGLGADARIQVKLQDSDITRWIIGPYNYEVSGDGFLLTQGEQSFTEMFMGSPKSEAVDTQEQEQPQEQTGNNLPLIIGGGAAAVVLALVVILVAALRKKKNKK